MINGPSAVWIKPVTTTGGVMHTDGIEPHFQPSIRPCAVKKGGNETNIRKEPATCRNFQQVHWLCVWRLALFGKFGLAVLNIHNAFVFTHRAKDRKPSRHRVWANFCPGFVVADRAVHPTVFYHSITLLYASILPYPPDLPLPTFSAKAAGFPAASVYIIFFNLST